MQVYIVFIQSIFKIISMPIRWFFRTFFSFSGRITVGQMFFRFWVFWIFVALPLMIISGIHHTKTNSMILFHFLTPIFLTFHGSVSTRRLHDQNESGLAIWRVLYPCFTSKSGRVAHKFMTYNNPMVNSYGPPPPKEFYR